MLIKGVTEEFLRKEGFREYNPLYMDYAEKCFEREYKTKYGSYFLIIKKYGEMYKNDRLMFSERYEAYARLFKYGTHEQIEITFDFKDIDEVNEFILQLFKNKLIESCREGL